MITKIAVKYLTWQIRKNKGLWQAYKSTIAVIIQDNYKKYKPSTVTECIHEFSNVCAEDFLNLWTRKC